MTNTPRCREGLARGDDSVYFLDALELEAEKIATSFSQFFVEEFMRNAQDPYDSMTQLAVSELGALRWDEHVAYEPPLLFGGDEVERRLCRLPARAQMVINGDIAGQCKAQPEKVPVRLDTYEDERGITRTRVVWD